MFSFLVAGSKAKGDADLQPAKGAVLMDIEDENEDVEKPAKEGGEKGEDVATPAEKEEDTVTEQTHHVVVPSYSAWFDYNSIHAIERRALPEFFNAKNTSKNAEV